MPRHRVVESVRKEIDGTIVASCRPRKRQSNICPPTAAGTAPSTTARRPQEVEDDGQGPVMASSSTPRSGSSAPSTGSSSQPCPGPSTPPLHARVRAGPAWLACRSQDRTAELMRIDWASVGGICRRVYDELGAEAGDRFDGLGPHQHRRLRTRRATSTAVVLDHDANRVVWCARRAQEGRAPALLRAAQRGSEGQHRW